MSFSGLFTFISPFKNNNFIKQKAARTGENVKMLNKAWNKHIAGTTKAILAGKDDKQTEGVATVKWLWQIKGEPRVLITFQRNECCAISRRISIKNIKGDNRREDGIRKLNKNIYPAKGKGSFN